MKIRNFSRYKLDPYFVGPFEVTGKQFNTVKLVDPNTKLPLERPVHIKNIIKFNSTNYTIVVTKEGTNDIKRK